ncbi:MAG: hypothetical protein EA399_06460 [Desulfovibrionales bacterium]|nr:MAG: hypothetical protein EA399_06460 [Desulfovibrionales bacterium]
MCWGRHSACPVASMVCSN